MNWLKRKFSNGIHEVILAEKFSHVILNLSFSSLVPTREAEALRLSRSMRSEFCSLVG